MIVWTWDILKLVMKCSWNSLFAIAYRFQAPLSLNNISKNILEKDPPLATCKAPVHATSAGFTISFTKSVQVTNY